MRPASATIFGVLLIANSFFPRLAGCDEGADGLADHEGNNQQQPHFPAKPSITFTLAGNHSGVEQERHQQGGGGGILRLRLPDCYSSSGADPSLGAWTMCEGGEKTCSPSYQENWDAVNDIPRSYRGCRPRWEDEHEGKGPMPYWTWEPSACNLEEVDAERFCRVMAGRKGLLFVGDSLTGQMIETLASILRAETVHSTIIPVGSKWAACDGTLKFSWYRNDYLDTRTTEKSGPYPTVHCKEPDVSDTRCVVFADDAILGEYDTLVVNSGQHRSLGGMEEYAEMMNSTSAFLAASMHRLHGNDAILVVRNTPPGHRGSYERVFDGPVDAATANRLVEEGPPEYEWYTMPDKNEVREARRHRLAPPSPKIYNLVYLAHSANLCDGLTSYGPPCIRREFCPRPGCRVVVSEDKLQCVEVRSIVKGLPSLLLATRGRQESRASCVFFGTQFAPGNHANNGGRVGTCCNLRKTCANDLQ